MCGITGIVRTGRRDVDGDVLRRMSEAIRHRGPDDDGFFEAPGVGLAMRRLSIIDVAGGAQPIANEDGTVTIVYNGEIYNHEEVRSELLKLGHRFRTSSDTEAVVHAYEEWGEECVTRLNGMFAFAIWDEPRQRLMLARDRVGKKPLLYADLGDELVFGSEFSAVLAHPRVSRDPDDDALRLYLGFQCVPAPWTAFRAIRKLEPGHVLVWERGHVATRRYWRIEREPKVTWREDEARERLLALLEDAVRIRLMSEVPLGAFLSGGIDSSAVVALMAKVSPSRVKTFTIGFEEEEYSEVEHARAVAQAIGTEHHEEIVQPDALEILPTLVRHYGEPYADSSAIPTYYVCRAARRHVTVALNGDGGDEGFGGYERYAGMGIAERYRKLPAALRAGLVEPAVRSLVPANRDKGFPRKVRRFVDSASQPPARRYGRWTLAIAGELFDAVATPDFARRTASADPLALLEAHFRAPFGEAGEGIAEDVVEAAMRVDAERYLPDDLLVKVDIASMAVSLEARSPLLDYRVLEFAAKLPIDLKVRGKSTKYLLRRAFEGALPSEILRRPKMGFGVPVGRWLRKEFRPLVDELLLSEGAARRGYLDPRSVRRLVDEHVEGRVDRTAQLWTLLMMEMWFESVARGGELVSAGCVA
jgi:asparagine synthase (glutamine-hydrolysing)